MARCDICDKGITTGRHISITRSQVSRRAKRTWKPNIKNVKIVEDSGNVKTIHVCAKCLRSNQKNPKFTRAI